VSYRGAPAFRRAWFGRCARPDYGVPAETHEEYRRQNKPCLRRPPHGGRGPSCRRITVTGRETEFPLPAGSKPESIALGADGTLWFSDGSAARVARITPAGQVTFFAVPTLSTTDEVVAGAHGADERRRRLWRIDPL
jgi:hypothetical protein